jgi:hypothetical protein
MKDISDEKPGKEGGPWLRERQLMYVASLAGLSFLFLLVAAIIDAQWAYTYWWLFLGNVLIAGLALYQIGRWRRR